MDKKITVTIGTDEIDFSVSSAAHKNFLNSVKESNKVAPVVRFLQDTVAPESKETLDKYIDWYFIDIAGVVLQELKPEIEITVKK